MGYLTASLFQEKLADQDVKRPDPHEAFVIGNLRSEAEEVRDPQHIRITSLQKNKHMKEQNRRQFIKTMGLATGGTILIAGCDFPGSRNNFGFGDTPSWIADASKYVLTPASSRVLPRAITRTEGDVSRPGALLRENGRACRITYKKGAEQPIVVIDFGAQSLGGYAVFVVKARTGLPVVRLAYACHPDGLSETGCFARETSARYLGPKVDLPVLPGNVNRHELYTIAREGVFIAPLIQGQTRYVRLQLDTPDTSVDIDTIMMINSGVYDNSLHDGFFLCSDERLNRLWYISTWTMQIASMPDHDAFKTIEGWLSPRKLKQSHDINLSKKGAGWKDVIIETVFEIRKNPHYISAAGLAFRARDHQNAYMVEMTLDGVFRLIRRVEGEDRVIGEKMFGRALTDGIRYRLKIEAIGDMITTSLDNVVVDQTRDGFFSAGRAGFYTPKEKWPLFDMIDIKDGRGETLLFDDFSGDLSEWEFARTLSYVSDGAKRDRLVWSGDLYFAQRNAYYAFSDPSYMRESLKMLAFNQTPQGFVHAAPYPENSKVPGEGNYGLFQSDEFAAWLIPVAWDHLLFTDDTDTLHGIWPAIKNLVKYLQSHTDAATGLFVQREDTSKHAGNLNLGDTRTRSYMHILLWGAYRDAARIAGHLGFQGDEMRFQQMANQTKEAVNNYFWDKEGGFFREAIETPGLGFYANALALAMGIATKEQAQRIAPQLTRDWHGKFQSLASRGKFEYGFGHSGLQAIFDHNWLRLLDESWEGATTTHECMTMITNGWGDESHPDTSIAGHFSSYVLGIVPEKPGYKRFIFRPQPAQQTTWAKGLVPTPNGSIHASWSLQKETMAAELSVPEGTIANTIFPDGCHIFVNGVPSSGKDLPAGVYVIEVRDLPEDAWNDLTAKETFKNIELALILSASSSIEKDGWSLDNLFAPPDDKSKRGYSSKAHQKPDAQEWIEIDMGKEVVLSGIIMLPRSDSSVLDAQPSGFPRDFVVQIARESEIYETVAEYKDAAPQFSGLHVDLYTVIGYPTARYIRIKTTRLGAPAIEEPRHYRLQLERVMLMQP